MYGYFKPGSSGLTHEERKLFNSYYCRICYCLRILGGQSARFLTTYDVAIYSIILRLARSALTPPPVRCQRLATGMMKQYRDDEMGLRLARVSLVVFGEKIRDDYLDGENLKAAGMEVLFKKLIADACAAEPEIRKIALEGTDRINEMQDSGQQVERILDTYGEMVADIFCKLYPMEDDYRQLIKNIAVWTFYVDMLNDYAKDYKRGKYNGFTLEGCDNIQSCFDRNYLFFLYLNRKINNSITSQIEKIRDDSKDWIVLNKIVNCAIGTTAFYILCGNDVEFKFWKGCKNIPYRLRYGKGKSNFR